MSSYHYIKDLSWLFLTVPDTKDDKKIGGYANSRLLEPGEVA